MSKDQKPVYNTAGTHVFTQAPNGEEWECPVDVLDVFLARGFILAQPRDKSLDGLFDDSTAEGVNQTGFDPAKATVAEVNEHLTAHLSSPGEIARVMELEAAGRNRPGVTDPRLSDQNPGD